MLGCAWLLYIVDYTDSFMTYLLYFYRVTCTILSLTAMENNSDPDTSNFTGFLSQGGYIAYNSVLLAVFLFPILVLNVVILFALIIQKSIFITVRLVLGCLTVAGIVNGLGLVMQRLAGLILAATLSPHADQSPGICRFILFTILSGTAARLAFMALFAITVLVIVVAPAKYSKPVPFLVVALVVWFIVIVYNFGVFSPAIGDARFSSGVSCAPLSVGIPTIMYLLVYVIDYAFIPLLITLILPILVLCFIYKRTISSELETKKAMARFALFLLIGNVINFMAVLIPAAVASRRTEESRQSSGVVEYLPYAFMILSLVPTPILMIVFFKSIRKSIWKLCTCCCPSHGPETTSKPPSSKLSTSKNTKISTLDRKLENS